jgi:hypothetical protein
VLDLMLQTNSLLIRGEKATNISDLKKTKENLHINWCLNRINDLALLLIQVFMAINGKTLEFLGKYRSTFANSGNTLHIYIRIGVNHGSSQDLNSYRN